MADSTSPPAFDLNKGIYFPQLTEMFVISQDPAYDYYSTNSGMYPKNPGGGGGGGGEDLSGRVANIETKLGEQHVAAKESSDMLSAIITGEELSAIDDIVNNQLILSASQEHLYESI